jgi:N-acetylneuraminate synthase
MERAGETIIAASLSGADACKFQTWTPDGMDCGERVIDSGPWRGKSLRDLYRQAHTPWEWHNSLIDICKTLGLDWWSTPFDAESVDFLESLNCPRYKIASFEIVDLALIRKVARTNKPIIISTGMANLREVDEAVNAAARAYNITLLRCVSGYPASPEDYNLASMVDMGQRYGCEVGLSDHTKDISVPVTAAVLGASMIERHLTLNRADGLDDGFASEPAEFLAMTKAVKTALDSIGSVKYGPTDAEYSSLALRRSLWVTKDMLKGEVFTDLKGKRAKQDINAGTPMKWELCE